MTELIRVSNFLRLTLLADAATCLACGLMLAFGGVFLQELLGLPSSLTFYAGLSLFPFAALLLYAATRRSISKTVVWVIIALNILWTIDSFLLLISGYVSPTGLGYTFVSLQALGVLMFAVLEFAAMKKAKIIGFSDAEDIL